MADSRACVAASIASNHQKQRQDRSFRRAPKSWLGQIQSSIAGAASWAEHSSSARPIPGADGYIATAPVDAYEPNGFGLYNLAGNVWEWCEDYFSPAYHRATA